MTTPDLAYEDENGNRRYRQPLTGRDDYLSMTGVLSLFPNDIHKIPPATLERAGRRGDWLHQVLQDRTWDEQLIPPLDIPECREDLESLRWFMTEWQPRIIHQELTVFNDTHGIAGQLDIIAEFPKGIGVAVGDLKTSRDVRPSYPFQLAGYGAAEYAMIPDGKDGWKRIELPEIESHVIMHIRGDQRRLIPVETAGMEEVVFELAAIAHELHPWLERGATAVKHPIAAPNPGHGLLDSRIAIIRERIGTMNDEMKADLKDRMATSGINFKDPATTHEDLDIMNDHLLAVDRQLGDVPDAWDERARDDFGARIEDLPPDLKLDVEGPTRQYLDNTGLKGSNMAGQHVRQHHVDFAMNRLTSAEAAAAERYMQLVTAAEEAFFNATPEELTASLELVARVASAARTSDPDYLQEFEAESAIALLEAIGVGLVLMADNGVRVAEHAGEMLVKRWGSKSDVVKAGKDAADARQMTRPRSAADVAADPMIAAATYKAATETAAPAA